jgi:hypothetical protein
VNIFQKLSLHVAQFRNQGTYNDAYDITEIRRHAIIICSQRCSRTWAATSLMIIGMWKEL